MLQLDTLSNLLKRLARTKPIASIYLSTFSLNVDYLLDLLNEAALPRTLPITVVASRFCYRPYNRHHHIDDATPVLKPKERDLRQRAWKAVLTKYPKLSIFIKSPDSSLRIHCKWGFLIHDDGTVTTLAFCWNLVYTFTVPPYKKMASEVPHILYTGNPLNLVPCIDTLATLLVPAVVAFVNPTQEGLGTLLSRVRDAALNTPSHRHDKLILLCPGGYEAATEDIEATLGTWLDTQGPPISYQLTAHFSFLQAKQLHRCCDLLRAFLPKVARKTRVRLTAPSEQPLWAHEKVIYCTPEHENHSIAFVFYTSCNFSGASYGDAMENLEGGVLVNCTRESLPSSVVDRLRLLRESPYQLDIHKFTCLT